MTRILIVEDERSISAYIKLNCLKCFKTGEIEIYQVYFLKDAFFYLESNTIHILLLDLNLNQQNGFDVLKKFYAHDFFTIIIYEHHLYTL